jgi:hypothetical protein
MIVTADAGLSSYKHFRMVIDAGGRCAFQGRGKCRPAGAGVASQRLLLGEANPVRRERSCPRAVKDSGITNIP